MDFALGELIDTDPAELAEELRQNAPEGWVDALAAELTVARAPSELSHILTTWDMSQSQFGVLMGVSRQAIGKWQEQLPADRAVAIADLAAATDLLERYLKPERIAAVVRRCASALDDRSLIDLIGEGRTDDVLEACRTMFDPSAMAG